MPKFVPKAWHESNQHTHNIQVQAESMVRFLPFQFTNENGSKKVCKLMKIEISGKRLKTVTGRINLEFILLSEIDTTVKEATQTTLDGIE